MERIGGEIGRVALAGREATQLRDDVAGPEARRIEQRCPIGQQSAGAGGGERRAAALGVEGDGGDPAVLRPDRDPHEIAADVAAGAADVGALRNGPAPMGLAQVLLEEVHAPEDKPGMYGRPPRRP